MYLSILVGNIPLNYILVKYQEISHIMVGYIYIYSHLQFSNLYEVSPVYEYIIEGSLEVKLPTI